jgi:DNA-binding transcriptional regulator LsrR (DeoR family)
LIGLRAGGALPWVIRLRACGRLSGVKYASAEGVAKAEIARQLGIRHASVFRILSDAAA